MSFKTLIDGLSVVRKTHIENCPSYMCWTILMRPSNQIDGSFDSSLPFCLHVIIEASWPTTAASARPTIQYQRSLWQPCAIIRYLLFSSSPINIICPSIRQFFSCSSPPNTTTLFAIKHPSSNVLEHTCLHSKQSAESNHVCFASGSSLISSDIADPHHYPKYYVEMAHL